MQKCLNITIWRNQTELSCPPHVNRLLRWGGLDLWTDQSINELESILIGELLFLAEQIEQLCWAHPEIDAVRLRGGNKPIRSIEQLMRDAFDNYNFVAKAWL